jgi:hypothetical protein
VAGVFDPAAALREVDGHLDAADHILDRMPRHHAVTRFGAEMVRAVSRLEAIVARHAATRSQEAGIGDAPSPKIDASAGALGGTDAPPDDGPLRAKVRDVLEATATLAPIRWPAELHPVRDSINRLAVEFYAPAPTEEASGGPPPSGVSSAGAAGLGKSGGAVASAGTFPFPITIDDRLPDGTVEVCYRDHAGVERCLAVDLDGFEVHHHVSRETLSGRQDIPALALDAHRALHGKVPFGVVAAIKQPPCPECGEPMRATSGEGLGVNTEGGVWECSNGHPPVWCPRIPPPLPDAWRCCECGEENSGAWPECLVCGRARDWTPFDMESERRGRTRGVEAVATVHVGVDEPEFFEGFLGDPQTMPSWTCPSCHQRNSGWSRECGRCDRLRPVRDEPLCDACWSRLQGDREPVRLTAHRRDPCVACGSPTDGIVRRMTAIEIDRARSQADRVAAVAREDLRETLEEVEREQAAGSPGRCDEPPLTGTAPSPADVPEPGSAEQYRRWLLEAHRALAHAVKRMSALKFNAQLANRHTARALERNSELEGALAGAISYITANVKPKSPGVVHMEESLLAVLNAERKPGLPELPEPEVVTAFGVWRRECLRAAREVAVTIAKADEQDMSPDDMGALIDEIAPTATALVSLLELEHGCNDPDETPVDRAMTRLETWGTHA